MRGSLWRTLVALPTLLRVGFAETLVYRAEFLVWILAYTMPVIMLALWSAVAREGRLGRFGEQEFQAYFLATLVVRLLTGAWVVWAMNTDVRQGTLQLRLLRPVHPLVTYLAENLAALPLRVALLIPIALAGVWVFDLDPFHLSTLQVMVVPLSLVGAFLLTFLPMACIGTLSLFWESSIALYDLWLGLYTVLSGYVMPLEFFPDQVRSVIDWLPFRQTLAFPVESMLGLSSKQQMLRDLSLQWAWIGLFFVLLTRLWRAGTKRFSAYGG